MKVKFQVLGASETSFVSPKSGRQYNRARLIGTVVDPYDGTQSPAVADLAFDAPALSKLEQSGVFLLDCTKMDFKNGMAEFTFSSLEPFKSSKG